MSIELSCKNCDARLSVSADWVGQQVRCPQCDYIFRCEAIQRPTQASPESSQPAEETPEVVADDSPEHFADRLEVEPSPQNSEQWLMHTPEGSQFGPVDKAKLDNWVSEGRVANDCELRRSDSEAWVPAGQIYPMLVDQGNPFATRSRGHLHQNRDPHRGRMILGLALAGCVIPLVSFWASVMGTGDLRRMQLGRIDPSGESLTRAGQVIATVASMIWIVVFATGLLVLLIRAMGSF